VSLIHDLHRQLGQSIWLDSLTRSHFEDGHLDGLIDLGVRGLTCNPTLLAQAIRDDPAYVPALEALAGERLSGEELYWRLVDDDVASAAAAFRPLYDTSAGGDGFVSVEVSPELAHDAAGTVASAVELRARYGAPNVLVKIPATPEGVVAIEEATAVGISVNVTLIFSLERYADVLGAYERGLERLLSVGGDASTVASVASFFVSRVDTEIDARLESLAARAEGDDARDRILDLRGRAALAHSRLAYAMFRERLDSPTWQALAQRGARPQRLLWASTGAKNPTYSDLIYVDGLIGPDTVNTMPEKTIRAYADHGVVARTVDAVDDDPAAVWAALAEVGVSTAEVSSLLEQRGLEQFSQSFDDVRESLVDRVSQFA
jgi:transaldolase